MTTEIPDETSTNIAEWWADGWWRAYERRANAYFNQEPPPEVFKKMMHARDRMDEAFRREQACRDARSEAA